MSKIMVPVLMLLAFAIASPNADAQRNIYKVVNPDGSVTYTDERPSPGAEPVELKPLSVVETEKAATTVTPPSATEEPAGEPTTRDVRRMFRDFRITQPQHEETFWGTGNQVTIGWGASEQPLEGMSVELFIDGQPQQQPAAGSVTLEFERGEHRVRAVLRDAGKRSIAQTDTVVFFVKQHSVNFN